jgi:hypothetical protein
MNEYSNEDPEAAPLAPWECDSALRALLDIYLEAGLSEENAWRSALADLKTNFGPMTTCAA